MAQNYVQCGDAMQYTAGGAIASGTPVLVGDLLGVALTSAAVSGDIITLAVEGVFTLTKKTHASTEPISKGAKVYWEVSSSKITYTDNTGANKHVGYAFEAAASTDSTVQVRLLG